MGGVRSGRAFRARGFAALCFVLSMAAPAGAWAAPTETVLYSFKGGSDGGTPFGGLIADSSGNLYGTTQQGGAFGAGTVFELAPNGTETVLYSFTGGSDGGGPVAGLIADASGNFYGTAQFGGTSGHGVVFKVSPGGTETVLYSFKGGSDGDQPISGLYRDNMGNLYGTTLFGGGMGASGEAGAARCLGSRRAAPRRCSTCLRATPLMGVFPIAA